jgi:hypothetical protein
MRTFFIHFCFLVCIKSFYIHAESSLHSDQIVLSATYVSPYVDHSSLEGGILPLLIKTIFFKKNIPVKINFHQHDEWKKDFDKKKVLGHFPVTLDQNQEEKFLKSFILKNSFYVYTIKENALANKIAGIPPNHDTKKDVKLTYCIPKLMLKIPELKKTLTQNGISYITALTANGCKFKLINQECNGFIDEELHALSIGLQSDAQDLITLKKSEKPFFTTNIYVIFNKDIPKIDRVKNYFDALLEEARKNGTLAEVLKRFYEYWQITQ